VSQGGKPSRYKRIFFNATFEGNEMRYSAIDLLRLIETAEPVAPKSTQSTIQPHSARYCSDLASPLLKAQQQNDKAQARLGFGAFDLSLSQGK
jgi:hypothetical protein